MTRQRFRLSGIEMAVITITAMLATLAVFSTSPETLALTSADGIVTLTGEVLRSLGEFRIVRDDAARRGFAPDSSAPVYRLEPPGAQLARPLTISFSLVGVGGANREALALASWNAEQEQWELASSTYDPYTDAVRAPVRALGFWTLRER